MSNGYALRNAVEDLTFLRRWSPEYRKIVLRHYTGRVNLALFTEEDYWALFRGLEVDPNEISKTADAKRKNAERKNTERRKWSA